MPTTSWSVQDSPVPISSLQISPIQISPAQFSRLNQTRKAWLDELAQLLSFPSISAQPKHHRDILANAHWLVQHLSQIGLRHAKILSGVNGGQPSVYADWCFRPRKPTLLIYGHYDVQPVDPVSAWHSPPFKATMVGDHLFGRGASDDKGQLFIHLKALESYLKTTGHLPINVKIWLEGEEEINSPTCGAFLDRYQDLLEADAVLISDTEMISRDCPTIIYGLRGSLTAELEVFGPKHDLHSGRYGGIVHNPLQALCEMLSSLHDRSGRIAIQGFYEHVRSDLQRVESDQPCSCCLLKEQKILRDLDINTPWGEPGYSLNARLTSRPALIINGIQGGYTGPGTKSVIPSKGSAKFSLRLVPNQTPQAAARLLKNHFARIVPHTVKTKLKIGKGVNPVILPVKHPIMQAATRAFQKAWGKTPILTRSGGTISVVEEFQKRMQVPILLVGFGLPDDDIHAPNEKISLSQFFRGVETSIQLLAEMAQL